MPVWVNMSMAVHGDMETNKVCGVRGGINKTVPLSASFPLRHPSLGQAWGWVQEMYAFCMSLWVAGIRDVDMYPHIMAQPPYNSDFELKPGEA